MGENPSPLCEDYWKNPFYHFKPLAEPNDCEKYFSYEETEKLLEILETQPNEKLKHLMRISIFTGLRREEILTIRREDVNLSEQFFHHVNQ